MSGLLKKDLYVADRSVRMLLVLALIFSLIPGMEAFGNTYSMMLAIMVPLNAIGYDEKSKWDRYAAVLPYRTENLVWTKYLLAYIFALLAEAILVLGVVIRNAVTPSSANWSEFFELSVLLLTAAVFFTAVSLPIVYRFGTEKGRLAVILALGGCLGVAMGVAKILGERPLLPLPELPLGAILGIAAVLAVLVTFASFRLSVYFYKKRQNGAYN